MTKGQKVVFQTQVYGTRAASWMMTLWPLMGRRRRDRIRHCLAAWKEQEFHPRDKTHCKRGHPLSGDNLIQEGRRRHCRTCKNARNRAHRARHLAEFHDQERERRTTMTPEQKEARRLYQQAWRANRDREADRLAARRYDAKRRAKRSTTPPRTTR
jgi:hypothetical protein